MVECTTVIGRTTVRVIKGDITKVHADALVNPANSLLIMGGGVAGALKRAGGEEIEREALRHAPLPVGRAIATTAGRLPARYIIHTPTMERPAMRTTVDKIRQATIAALKLAEELGLKSLAFPGMGTGVGGVNPQDAAKAMVQAIKEHMEMGSNISYVLLVAYTQELFEAFCKELD